MKSGAISIDRYAGGEPAEQFDFLYENFSILQELLKDYREELIMLEPLEAGNGFQRFLFLGDSLLNIGMFNKIHYYLKLKSFWYR